MSIIRIQTSLKAYKLNIKSLDITLHELKSVFNEQINVTIDKIIFSYDMNGNKLLLGDNNTLKQLNLLSGSLIYLYGRLIKNEISKSYIDEKGLLISKGITYDIISNEASNESDNKDNIKLNDKDNNKDSKDIKHIEHKEETVIKSVNDVKGNQVLKENSKEINQSDYNDYDEIRPADPIRKIRLIDNDEPEPVARPKFPFTYTNDESFNNDTLSAMLSAGVSNEELLASLINDAIPIRKKYNKINNKNTSRNADNNRVDRHLDRYIDGNLNGRSNTPPIKVIDTPIIEDLNLSEEEMIEQVRLLQEYEIKTKHSNNNNNKLVDRTNLVPVDRPNGSSYEYLSPTLIGRHIDRNAVRKADSKVDDTIDSYIDLSANSLGNRRETIILDDDSDEDIGLAMAINQSLSIVSNNVNDKVDNKIDNKIDNKLYSKKDNKTDNKIVSKVDSHIDKKVDKKRDSKTDNAVSRSTNRQIDNQISKKVKREINPLGITSDEDIELEIAIRQSLLQSNGNVNRSPNSTSDSSGIDKMANAFERYDDNKLTSSNRSNRSSKPININPSNRLTKKPSRDINHVNRSVSDETSGIDKMADALDRYDDNKPTRFNRSGKSISITPSNKQLVTNRSSSESSHVNSSVSNETSGIDKMADALDRYDSNKSKGKSNNSASKPTSKPINKPISKPTTTPPSIHLNRPVNNKTYSTDRSNKPSIINMNANRLVDEIKQDDVLTRYNNQASKSATRVSNSQPSITGVNMSSLTSRPVNEPIVANNISTYGSSLDDIIPISSSFDAYNRINGRNHVNRQVANQTNYRSGSNRTVYQPTSQIANQSDRFKDIQSNRPVANPSINQSVDQPNRYVDIQPNRPVVNQFIQNTPVVNPSNNQSVYQPNRQVASKFNQDAPIVNPSNNQSLYQPNRYLDIQPNRPVVNQYNQTANLSNRNLDDQLDTEQKLKLLKDDEEYARKLQLEIDEMLAKRIHYKNKNENNEIVNDFAVDYEMIDRAILNNDNIKESVPYYDEDDEMLARVLEESLNYT